MVVEVGSTKDEASSVPEVSILVPAYACGEEVSKTCESLQGFFEPLVRTFEILVIVNGPPGPARNETLAAARTSAAALPRLRVLESHPPGKGHALREGLLSAQGRFVLFTDCDLPYDLSFFPKALGRLREGIALVHGDRRHPESDASVPQNLHSPHTLRRALSRLFNFAARTILGLSARDTQAGIKAMDASFAKAVALRCGERGFLSDLEYFLVAKKGGWRVEGHAVHFSLRDLQSSVVLGREFRKTLVGLLRIFLSRALGRFEAKPRSLWATQWVSWGILSGRFSRGLAERAFVAARWVLTPYRTLASFVPTSGLVVDVGAGHGLLTAHLALECPERRLFAVDHDPQRLSLIDALGLENISTLCGDMRDIALSKKAAAILAIDCMHYLPTQEQSAFLAWAFENLAPGGVLLMREIDPESGWAAPLGQAYEKAAIACSITKTKSKTFCVHAPHVWTRLLEDAGFGVVSHPCTAPLLSDRLFVARKPHALSTHARRPAACITADDWGMSKAINEGILDLAQRGLVRRVSVLPEAPFAGYLKEDLLRVEGLEIGLHASLTLSLRNGASPDFNSIGELARFLLRPRPLSETVADLQARFVRQLSAAREAKFPIVYADGHQHVHVFPLVSFAFSKALKGEVSTVRVPFDGTRWGLRQCVLNFFSSISAVIFSRHGFTWLPFRYPSLQREWRNALRARRFIDTNPGVEAIVHPALRDDLAEGPVQDTYRAERVAEHGVLAKCDVLEPLPSATSSWFSKRPTVAFTLTSACALFLLHFAVWLGVVFYRQGSLESVLKGFDSGWYLTIATNGYSGQAWAFFPVWPLVLAGLNALLSPSSLALAGTVLATALFFTTARLLAKSPPWDDSAAASQGFGARTRLGILLFLLTPASYVFHSNHTESLYLLLTVLACVEFQRRRLVVCAIVCGVAALTKVQGVLLAAAFGVGFALREQSFRLRARTLTLFGALSGLLFALWPLYEYIQTGDALHHVTAQSHWHPPASIARYFGALLMLNPEQSFTPFALVHSGVFFGLLCLGVLFARAHLPFALYSIAFLALEPLTGELVGTLRYATVLFPLHFLLGDSLARREARFGGTGLAYATVCGFFALNMAVTAAYALGRWAY
ncbi:MAG: ChbG/HpnK family deacetylase [Silvanigrellales bacterium]|nr:ChbG/HpnK family deacetylase [Silvanigrellales bacterium]